MNKLLIILALCCACSAQVANQLVTMSGNGQYFFNSVSGKPVFLTGDSPQLLPTMLCASDVTQYLNDRASRGFNVLWVILVDNVYSTTPPNNCNGAAPFTGGDFNALNATYWAYIDTIVSAASARGITLLMNVAFIGLNGSQGYFTDWNGGVSGATINNYCTTLANRYKTANNIIWLLGGDFDPVNTTIKTNIAGCIAALIAADTNHIVTIEVCRACSPANQSTYDGYSGSVPSGVTMNWVYNTQPTVIAGCQAAYTHIGAIPPLFGEDWYELDNSLTSFQVRQEGWWETTSGCPLGRLLGSGAIWSFNSPNGDPCTAGTCTSGVPTWQSQLSSVGSVGQQFMGQLMRTREFWLCAPDTTHVVVTANFGSGATLTTTCRTTDGQSVISYFSDGNATAKTVDMTKITSATSTVKSWWYNPQTGAAPTLIGTFANSGTHNFTAPDANDWVLVLDDASAGLLAPGTSPNVLYNGVVLRNGAIIK